MKLAVGIATRGRPALLACAIEDLSLQTRQPCRILVAYCGPEDVGEAPHQFPHVEFLRSGLGLTRQRNAILDALETEDVVTDFFLDSEYLGAVADAFSSRNTLVMATGTVLADGINGPGLIVSEAREILARAHACERGSRLTPVFNAYGCNMSVRMAPVRSRHLRFDENLPLYGWYEDVDFSRQVARYGKVLRIDRACGVHLGNKSGRQSGFRLGYSQIANPFYLAGKHSVPWTYAIASMTSRCLKNLVRCVMPEPWVDRRGRLKGNLRGWRDLFAGAISPARILSL